MTSGDFKQLFAEQVGFVYRILQRHGLPERDLEDGCQEVFLTVFRRAAEFEERSSFRTWLYGIAVRVALGMRRKAFRRRELLVDAPEPATGAEPFDARVRTEAEALLMAALAELTRPKREVFVLYELEDMTMAEVASSLNIPENTALYRLYGAREAIAAYVRRSQLRCVTPRKRTGS